MTSLKFSIANNAVTHLGRNLYSTTPPALAELVANSYDAYATEVNIKLSNDSIVIIDNGKGLDLVELEQKYAIIGSEKQEEAPINGLDERKPMGKKGIGKLAAFSLGNIYTVYSKSRGSSANDWLKFTLNYRQMTASNDYDVEVTETELPEEFSEFESYTSGFIVKITDTRRRITEATRNNIRKQLSRRFYINQSKTNFKLKLDGQELELASNEYYNKIQYVVYFGNLEEDEIKSKFENVEILEKYSKIPHIATYFSNSNISGWIGTTNKPKDLKNEDGASFANIIILANGKIADEDILKSKSNARIANNYIVGEIVADDFISKLDDPITSSRQGLDDSIPEVEELILNLDKVRDFVIERWDEIRRENAIENLPERIKSNQSYTDWLSGLTEEQKKINNKLLDLFSNKLDDDVALDANAVDSMVTSISTVINNIEADDLIASFEEEEDSDAQYALLFKLMTNIAKMEDLNHANLIRKRLSAIEKLERLMADDSTAEKVFEKHLSDNPWLINPYWNVDRNTPTETDYLRNQEFFNLDRGNDEFKRNFLDISIRVAEEEYPIIIELKKNTADGYARVDFNMINEQITNYRQAMIQNIPELRTVDETDIKVIFVLSENTGMIGAGNKIEFTAREKQMLDISNITILKYSKIIAEARKMYQDHLKYQKEAKLIPDLSTDS
ncbi:ATP-binding protein [Streptococcus oriscaviae]|uniref:ATP-binding protein n=1 Tax=Streptococcus oriscaviae TaxID=2781599 RepID=A0ABX7YJU1_9STRE|nr:ATP-binding protein [Streptococcus oriscaviae]QUE53778.1 ATP-binding protein [Streptococcus oriscaviae]